MSTLQSKILSKISGSEKLINRGTFLEPPVTWKNNVTQLNQDNLNKMSRSVLTVQTEFNQVSAGLEEILIDIMNNNAGWKSTESTTGGYTPGLGEIFNDYENNRAVADYTSARGFSTMAGKGYSNNGTVQISGTAASTEGWGTVATSDYQHVIGKWNILDESDNLPGNTYAFIIGNGNEVIDTDGNTTITRSNAFTVDWTGSGWFANNLNVTKNANIGTSATDNHIFNGKVCFKHSIRTHTNLKVDGDVKLGNTNKTTSVVVNSGSTFNKTATFNDNVIFDNADKDVSIKQSLNVTGDSSLSKVAVSETLDVTGKTTLNDQLKVRKETTLNNSLTVTGQSSLTGALTVDSATTLNDTLHVTGATTIKNNLEVGRLETPSLQLSYTAADDDNVEKETFTVNCDTILSSNLDVLNHISSKTGYVGNLGIGTGPSDDYALNLIGNSNLFGTLSVDGDSELSGKLQVTDVIDGHADIKSTTDLKIEEGTYLVSVKDEHNHLDYVNLDVQVNDDDTDEQKKAKKTVPNAIKKLKDDLIGSSSITEENIGQLSIKGLDNTTIHGVAEYALNLVKNLLNAYILDGDNDDHEEISAIDKLIEISDWIKDDNAGAVKIINDLTNEIDRATTADKILTDDLASEAKRATSKEDEINNALKLEIDRAKDAEAANADAISILTGSSDGSVSKAIADAKTELTTEIDKKLDKTDKYVHPSYDVHDSGLYKIIVDEFGHISSVVAVSKDDIVGLGIPPQDTTYEDATADASGLLSAADKTTYDGYAVTIADLQGQIDALKALVESYHSVVEEPEEPVDPETPIEPETPAEPENVEGEE